MGRGILAGEVCMGSQYFMTKDTEEFSQFTESVACREYSLPRDEKSSDPKKVGFEGTSHNQLPTR